MKHSGFHLYHLDREELVYSYFYIKKTNQRTMLKLLVFLSVCACSCANRQETVNRFKHFEKEGRANLAGISILDIRRLMQPDRFTDKFTKRGYTFSPWGGKRSRMRVSSGRNGAWDNERIQNTVDLVERLNHQREDSAHPYYFDGPSLAEVLKNNMLQVKNTYTEEVTIKTIPIDHRQKASANEK